ncbi:MAG TPA: DinB family protein [Pyrinomonadaceae bacterium]|jgi:hypothetical protein
MQFNSVSEIFDDIDGSRERLLRSVEGLSGEQQRFRPAPDRWSAAQLCEHLASVEWSVVKLLSKLLGKAEESGAARAEGAAFEPVSIAEYVERIRDVRLEAPETVRPGDSTPMADALEAMRGAREALHALRPRIERADGHAVRFPHPAFGPLNLYQWLLFVGAHESRHLAQLEALKEAMGAPPGAGA